MAQQLLSQMFRKILPEQLSQALLATTLLTLLTLHITISNLQSLKRFSKITQVFTPNLLLRISRQTILVRSQ
jgi:hypothetical protein